MPPVVVDTGAAGGRRKAINAGCPVSPVSGSTPAETFRAALLGRTPEGEPSTVIVTRQGTGQSGRVWLTFNGAIKTTVVMTDGETAQLSELLDKAAVAR
jgi:hypothetical protein